MDGDALIFIVILILSFPAAIFFIAIATGQPLLPKRKAIEAAQEAADDLYTDIIRGRLNPLGRERLRILDCLAGLQFRRSHRFNPPEGSDFFTAYREYMAGLLWLWAEVKDPLWISVAAAGRLLCGDISAADIILDHLSPQPFMPRGVGYCRASAVWAMAHVLPIPRSLKEGNFFEQRWLAGSPVQAELRTWLDAHRDKLRWDEKRGLYHLADQHEGPSS